MEKRGYMRDQNIYCPMCAAEIYKYDGSHTMEVTVRCPHCHRYIRFKPIGMITKVISKPETTTSAGARFW